MLVSGRVTSLVQFKCKLLFCVGVSELNWGLGVECCATARLSLDKCMNVDVEITQKLLQPVDSTSWKSTNMDSKPKPRRFIDKDCVIFVLHMGKRPPLPGSDLITEITGANFLGGQVHTSQPTIWRGPQGD